MIIQIHASEPGGKVGALLTTIEREPVFRKSIKRDCIKFDGDWFPVITICGGHMIVVPAERFSEAKVMAIPMRTKHKRAAP